MAFFLALAVLATVVAAPSEAPTPQPHHSPDISPWRLATIVVASVVLIVFLVSWVGYVVLCCHDHRDDTPTRRLLTESPHLEVNGSLRPAP